MMRISPHHSEDIALLPCDFTVTSQKRLFAVIVIFLLTIKNFYELKCNNLLFTTISLFCVSPAIIILLRTVDPKTFITGNVMKDA